MTADGTSSFRVMSGWPMLQPSANLSTVAAAARQSLHSPHGSSSAPTTCKVNTHTFKIVEALKVHNELSADDLARMVGSELKQIKSALNTLRRKHKVVDFRKSAAGTVLWHLTGMDRRERKMVMRKLETEPRAPHTRTAPDVVEHIYSRSSNNANGQNSRSTATTHEDAREHREPIYPAAFKDWLDGNKAAIIDGGYTREDLVSYGLKPTRKLLGAIIDEWVREHGLCLGRRGTSHASPAPLQSLRQYQQRSQVSDDGLCARQASELVALRAALKAASDEQERLLGVVARDQVIIATLQNQVNEFNALLDIGKDILTNFNKD